MQALAFNWFKK